MELKYPVILYIGIPILVILIILTAMIKKKAKFNSGTKVANTDIVENIPYYKKTLFKYNILKIVLEVTCIISIVLCLILIATPIEVETVENEKYARDIFLCMDISTSVDELNLELIESYKEVVESLDGERFGISIFNTSSVLLVPLTDDYDYVISVLEDVEKGIKTYNGEEDYNSYYSNYNFSGTLVGNETRGSSLIGDGLATCAYDFINAETSDEYSERTRIIIFSTDNDLAGDPIVTLQEAGEICKENNITVFGVCPNFAYSENKEEMQSAIEKTGGSFYIFNSGSTTESIVNEIEKKGKSLVKQESSKVEVRKTRINSCITYGYNGNSCNTK